MLIKNRVLHVFILFCFFLNVFSQDKKTEIAVVGGVVYDMSEEEPVEMATVALFSLKDSTLVKGVATDKKGVFEIKGVPAASYYLSITFMGYKPVFINIPEHRFVDKSIDIGRINLDNSGVTLATVEITAELPELVVKEDTLEYNAAAFKMQEGAIVEDLIKRLPGVEVDTEGKITTSAGKQVKRVFVDGKEFFGNDPKMATKNLTADIVDKVQVVEKKSDLALLTGVDDDDPETIINITIKKGMKQGWMGSVTGGAGTLVDNPMNESARYTTGAMVNQFGEQNQISFIADANNINNQASSDFGNAVRSGRGRGGGGDGIVSSNTFGVNTANIINDRLKVAGNFRYNYSDNYSNSNSMLETMFNDSSTFRRSTSLDRNFSNNLDFNGKLEYRPDTLTTIIFSPTASYNWSSSNGTSSGELRASTPDGALVNSNSSTSTLKSDGISLRSQLDISRKLSSSGRRLSFSGWYNINNSSGDGTDNSEKIFTAKPTDIKKQISENTGDRNSYNLRLTYVEPLGRGNFINFSYNVQVNQTRNEKYTYDYDPVADDYILRDTAYNRSSYTKTINHNIRLNFNSNKEKYSYNVGFTVSPTYTKNEIYLKDWLVKGKDEYLGDTKILNRINFAPNLDFTYRFSQSRQIRRTLKLRYSGRTTQPSVSQLDPSISNPSAMNKRSGNPNLLPSFSNNISLDFNNYHREQQRSLNVSLTHSFVKDEFVNSTVYYDDGTQLSMPINVNGSWNSRLNTLYSQPLDSKKRFKMNSQLGFVYRNQIGFSQINKMNEKNISKTMNLNGSLGLSYSNDWFYGQVRGNMRYAETKYSLENVAGKESYNYTVSYNTQITLPYSFSMASDINYTDNQGLSAGMNKDEIIWNAQVSKQVFKKKNGSIRLQVTDILQQRLNIRRSVSNKSIQDTEYTALTSYVMLTFSYRFNNIGGQGRKRGGYSRSEDYMSF